MLAKALLELGALFGTAGKQVVGPLECGFVPCGQIAARIVVGDVIDKIFGETGLTGLVEADLASKPAVGDSGVAQPDQLLDVDINPAV